MACLHGNLTQPASEGARAHGRGGGPWASGGRAHHSPTQARPKPHSSSDPQSTTPRSSGAIVASVTVGLGGDLGGGWASRTEIAGGTQLARRDLEPAATVDLRLWGVSGAGAGTDPSRLRIHFRSCAHARVGSGRVPPSGAAQVCACLAGLYPWKQSARRLDALVGRPPQSLGHHVQLEGRIISAPLGDDLGAPAALRHQKALAQFSPRLGFRRALS